LPSGTTIVPGRPIFPRVDIKRTMDRLQAQSERTEQAKQEEAAVPGGNSIAIEQFAQVELRVGTVLEAHRIPGSDRLLRLIVDLGEEENRQIVAGIAAQFNPRELLSANVVVVANLEPATIHGVDSQGMILAAGTENPEALIVTDRDCKPGTIIR